MHPFSQRQIPTMASVASSRVQKSSRRNAATKSNEDVELLFRRLVQMVPSLPKDRKLSRLEILQAVIDYIQELEQRLESHPESENLSLGLSRLKLSLNQARHVPQHNAQ
ncbi:hypothetical protein RvY_10104 [Ramazzottius varieornatus]|uniref:BHLH domain-containing protein n=1 Tax=Ramazzottius varieornatus TaxID=947166 RepID=A0A1D1VBM8_RAMVA|nr:hypothetical protein RvY_10104 [Ramazzottius varieornatus]